MFPTLPFHPRGNIPRKSLERWYAALKPPCVEQGLAFFVHFTFL
jgi:hypothetical protein